MVALGERRSTDEPMGAGAETLKIGSKMFINFQVRIEVCFNSYRRLAGNIFYCDCPSAQFSHTVSWHLLEVVQQQLAGAVRGASLMKCEASAGERNNRCKVVGVAGAAIAALSAGCTDLATRASLPRFGVACNVRCRAAGGRVSRFT